MTLQENVAKLNTDHRIKDTKYVPPPNSVKDGNRGVDLA